MKTDNKHFERFEDFNYLGTALTNQNSVQEEQIEVRQCFLTFGAEIFVFYLLSKNLKIEIYRIIILPVFCKGTRGDQIVS
jgi:hypothetical protein